MKRKLTLSKERVCTYKRSFEQRLSYISSVNSGWFILGTFFCVTAVTLFACVPAVIVISGELDCLGTLSEECGDG